MGAIGWPASLDRFLQDVAQSVGPFTYSDFVRKSPTEEQIRQLRNFKRKFQRAAQYDDEERCAQIGKDIADFLKTVSVTSCRCGVRSFEAVPGKGIVASSEYHNMRKQYPRMRSFKDRDKESGHIRDLIDDLEAHGIDYYIYYNTRKNDNGCTVFYEKEINSATVVAAQKSNLIIQTIEEAYEQDGYYYDDIDEYSEDYYEMPASDIKLLYGLYDGSNVDTGIETVDGRFYIAYSGHPVVQVANKAEMLAHFE